MGRELKGIYHLLEDRIYAYEPAKKGRSAERDIEGLDPAEARDFLGERYGAFRRRNRAGAGRHRRFDLDAYRAAGRPRCSSAPRSTTSASRSCWRRSLSTRPGRCRGRPGATVEPTEPKLTGFVFKIQANMDPGHRDRIAFMRLCSGRYERGMRLCHVRLEKECASPMR